MTRFSSLLLAVLSLLLPLLSFTDAAACPKETLNWQIEEGKQVPATLDIVNQSPLPLVIHWVDPNNGDNSKDWHVPMQGSEKVNTYSRQLFRIYGSSGDDKVLLLEYTVKEGEKEQSVKVLGDCDEVAEIVKAQREAVDQEMRALVHDQEAPCLPAQDSSQWSCIRHISKQDYDDRLKKHGGTKYGFNSTEEAGDRKIGDTVDHVWKGAIPKIPRVAKGKGYLKMSFTDKMKQVLLPFYEEHKRGGTKDSEVPHRTIPGGFTNSHVIQMSIIHLDRFPQVHQELISEIQRILEWWTNQTLVPTATFGIRNYHRGSMLINHVDRSDTHVASAVIQVAQDGVDEGWPLEVLHPDGSCGEVYLQPGELVLYEGARFQHGRPMRFNGESFANIFSHFRPVDWHGPGKSPNYDGKLDENGYLMTQDSNDEL